MKPDNFPKLDQAIYISLPADLKERLQRVAGPYRGDLPKLVRRLLAEGLDREEAGRVSSPSDLPSVSATTVPA